MGTCQGRSPRCRTVRPSVRVVRSSPCIGCDVHRSPLTNVHALCREARPRNARATDGPAHGRVVLPTAHGICSPPLRLGGIVSAGWFESESLIRCRHCAPPPRRGAATSAGEGPSSEPSGWCLRTSPSRTSSSRATRTAVNNEHSRRRNALLERLAGRNPALRPHTAQPSRTAQLIRDGTDDWSRSPQSTPTLRSPSTDRRRAAGASHSSITEGVWRSHIRWATMTTFPGWTPGQRSPWNAVVDAVHREDRRMFAELWDLGGERYDVGCTNRLDAEWCTGNRIALPAHHVGP